MSWIQDDAIMLCRQIEAVCPAFGCHVALTGGLLYKTGERKDCDILFYRIRQKDKINMDGLWSAMEGVGLVKQSGFGWCYKATHRMGNVDCFFPEEQEGEAYPVDEEAVGQVIDHINRAPDVFHL